MSLTCIDKSLPFRTDEELWALVDAIHSSPVNTQETNWVEWKRSLNLTTKEDQFKVAKTILGFANRSVEQASLVCEGVAYMVIGVEPGNAAGIAEIDHADLSQALKRWVDGPRWTLHQVQYAGVTVLVVVVEPPRQGNKIHTLQKEFSNGRTRHHAGAIFHRGTAQTEPAGPKEVEMLGERLLHGVRKPDLDVSLEASATDPLMRLNAGPQQVQEWLSRHEVYVRSKSGAPQPPPSPKKSSPMPGLAGLAGLDSLTGSVGGAWLRDTYARPEDRKQYEGRVEHYLGELRGLLIGNLFKRIVREDGLNKVYFSVGNETDDSISGVHLTVVIPRNGLCVYTLPPRVNPFPDFPRWPDPIRDRMAGISVVANPQDYYDFNTSAGSVTEADNAYEIAWDVGDLLPRKWSDDLAITVIAGTAAPDEVEIEVIARAKDRRGIVAKKLTLSIAPDELSLDDFFTAESSD